ncbi:MAG: tetratricopeptide repeat protein [Pseudomonadota bacterium]|nr:tetratricopeptide repeat protein [Pseudomonadota bacterium]
MLAATSRTAPCPCGSGKRYKDCHGAFGAFAPAIDTDELVQQAQRAFAAGRSANAEALLRHLIELAPGHTAAWNLLGEVLKPTDAVAASDAWWHVLDLDPDNAEASFHLGNRNLEQGEFGAAVIHYERALRGAPGHVDVLNNLGLCYKMLGATDRAEECYRAALAAEPKHPDALVNLANILFQREQYAEVIATTDRLLALPRGTRESIPLLRALAQERLGDVAGSEATLRDAARRRPDDPTIHAYLGTLYVRAHRYAEAEAPLQQSLAFAPDNAYALSMLAHARQHRCAWDGLNALFSRLETLLASEGGEGLVPVDAFSALSMPLSPLAQLHVAQRWARSIAPVRRSAPPMVDVAPGERLRVAFATANFRDHPTLHLSLEFWEKIDRSRLEMFAYSLRPDDDNPFLRRARNAFEHFADVSQETVGAIAQRIRDDRIAILIDRNGYTLHARETIFALRPAPLQINCIGFPGTLGASWYDYIFTDRFALPEPLQRFYTERPLYMPHMAFPSDTTRLPRGAPPSRAACGLPEPGLVFCCFNAAYKILPEVFAVWMRLLAAVPGSVLWLLETSAEAKANLRREATTAGIDAARIIFAPRLGLGAHMARQAVADLFLDTYPYGAHTTANDALLAGLPVLTCAGDTMVSRIAGSQLHAIGLPELITTSFADYEVLALKLAREPALLQGYRQRLAANRATAPLFDMARYARDFEDAMQRIWAEHCAGR